MESYSIWRFWIGFLQWTWYPWDVSKLLHVIIAHAFFFFFLSIPWNGYTTTDWINIYQLKDIGCSLCLNMNKASSVQDFVWLYMFHFSKISAKECDCWILCKCMFSRLPNCFIRVLYPSKPTSNVWEIEFLCIPANIWNWYLFWLFWYVCRDNSCSSYAFH